MRHYFLVVAVASSVLITACDKQKMSSEDNVNISENSSVSQSVNDDNAAAAQVSVVNDQDKAASEPVGQDWPVKQYTLYGSDQAWRVLVDLNQMTVEGADLPNGTSAVTRLAYAKGVEFTGQIKGKELGLNIRTQPCTDANKHQTEFTVTVYYDKKTYKGCAVEGIIEHADT